MYTKDMNVIESRWIDPGAATACDDAGRTGAAPPDSGVSRHGPAHRLLHDCCLLQRAPHPLEPLSALTVGPEIVTYITQGSTAAFTTQSRDKLPKDFKPLTFEPLKDYVYVWASCINPVHGKYCPLRSLQRYVCVPLEPPSSVNRGDYHVKNRPFYTLHAAIVVVSRCVCCVGAAITACIPFNLIYNWIETARDQN